VRSLYTRWTARGPDAPRFRRTKSKYDHMIDESEANSRRRFLGNAAAGATVLMGLSGGSDASPNRTANMKKLLLLSNSTLRGQKWLEYALPLIKQHFHASPATPRTVLFVPYARKDCDAYAREAAETLTPLGVKVVSAHTHEGEDPDKLLEKVDGVFVAGGNTFLLLQRLQRTNLLSAIKKRAEAGMPFVGVSAGTNIAAPTIKTTNDMPIVHPRSLDALDLVPFQINPHYVHGKFYYEEGGSKVPYNGETRADSIKAFHEQNDAPVVGLREGSALRVTGDKVELLGGKSAFLFEKGKDAGKVQRLAEITDGTALSALMAKQGAARKQQSDE
jgi:dipeptidase E